MLQQKRIETLWTLQHDAGVASCKLVSTDGGSRLVLLIDKDALQTQCCCSRMRCQPLANGGKHG